MNKILTSLFLAGVVATASFALTQDKPAAPAVAAKAQAAPAVDEKVVVATQRPSYPLTTCLVSNEPLAADSTVELVVEGRLYRLCCEKCGERVKADPAKFAAKVEAAVVETQKKSYPLDTCPISDEKLGGMGEAVDYVHGTRLVRFCCKSCVRSFQKDPAAAMAKVDAALIQAQLKDYPLTTCPVSDEALKEGETVDRLYGTRLVRLCCKSCGRELEKNPAPILAKLDAAAKTTK